jgi:hypothetical protein
MKRSISRRRLLQGLGGAALTLPFLRYLPSAHAAGTEIPKRLLIFFTPNEPIKESYWRPKSTGDLVLAPMLSPLAPYRDKILMLSGLQLATRDKDTFGGGHVGIGHMLTGRVNIPYGTENYDFWAGGISVDQFLAQRLGVEALTLAARAGGTHGNGRISYSGKNAPVHPVEDPKKAFDGWLGNVGLSDEELDQSQARRKRLLDSVAADIGSLKPSLPSADRYKLDAHLEAVHALEAKLAGFAPGAACVPGTPPSGLDYKSNADYPRTSRAMMDVATQVLACNLTRVASIQLGSSGSGGTPTWPDEGIDISIDEHNIAHAFNGGTAKQIEDREKLESFYYRQFAYLLEQLDSVQEGDGTLLDNTYVLWTKNIGYNHTSKKMLFMIAGGGTSLQTGRHLAFDDRPHNDLLITLCHLMGQTDVTEFGDPDFCKGPLEV